MYQEHEDREHGYAPQRDVPPTGERFAYDQDMGGTYGPSQKIYQQSQPGLNQKQRMTVAIVSLALLAPLCAVILEGNVSDAEAGNLLFALGRWACLLVVCLTIAVINLAVNWRR